MAESPTTQPSLLVRLRDPGDAEAWGQFVDLYAPLVYGYARRRGLQDADAADLTQDVLRAVAGAARTLDYDPARGTFRAWLFTVVRNQLRNLQAREKYRSRGGSSAQVRLENIPDDADQASAVWDQEYKDRLFTWAVGRVRGDFREATWRAFWRTAVEGASPRDAARELAMSVGAVYVARSRVVARLREVIQSLDDRHEP